MRMGNRPSFRSIQYDVIPDDIFHMGAIGFVCKTRADAALASWMLHCTRENNRWAISRWSVGI